MPVSPSQECCSYCGSMALRVVTSWGAGEYRSLASAGTTGGGDLAPCRDKTLFVAHMAENFEQYITTEIITQKVKITVTMDENKGECTMKGDVRLDFMRGRTGSASMQIIDCPSERIS